jgi:hypothetical protein
MELDSRESTEYKKRTAYVINFVKNTWSLSWAGVDKHVTNRWEARAVIRPTIAAIQRVSSNVWELFNSELINWLEQLVGYTWGTQKFIEMRQELLKNHKEYIIEILKLKVNDFDTWEMQR